MRIRRSGREAGANGEQLACEYLNSKGLKTVSRNYSTRQGELDLIMRDNDTLVFVEVRQRSRSHFGSGAESVTPQKQQKLIMAATHFLHKHHGNHPPPCRFDVISIGGVNLEKIDWIKDAFQPTG